MPGANPLGRTFVVALLAHVALFAIAGRPRAETPRVDVAAPALDLIAVEMPNEPLSPDPATPERASRESEVAPSTAPSLAKSNAAPRDAARPETGAVSSAMVLPESNGPASPSAPWTLQVTKGGQQSGGATSGALSALALDGNNRFMGRRVTPEEEERARKEQSNSAAGEAMRSALHDNDVALGLGGGGPVVSAVEAVVLQSLAPDESHAVLVAFADASGNVLRVEVESSSDDPAYRAVAADLLTRLQGQKVRVPPGAHGLAMRINVASRMANPSGGSVGIDPKSAGGHFDLSDIGARARRVVHSRVLAEQIL
jgi:hypothetical protein